MTRHTRPGSVQDTVKAALRAIGGLECASAELGVSISVLSYGTELSDHRPGGLGVNYLDRLGRIEPQAALPVAQHFAQLAGGVFHPVDIAGATAVDISDVTREFSDVLARHAEAHSASSENPGDYTPCEAQAQIAELDELLVAVTRLRAAMLQKASRS